MVKVNNGVKFQVLIHWDNLSVDEATWEDWGYIKNQFPEFVPQARPWGQGLFEVVGIVTILGKWYDSNNDE